MDGLDTAEMHWSAGTVLAIFFAASLISAVFFGLGYSFGRGGPLRFGHAAESVGLPAAASEPRPEHAAAAKRAVAVAASTRPARPIVAERRAKAAPVEMPAPRYMVQVAAVLSRRDAQTLVLQLRQRGFHATIYPGKHDKYLHVQMGPYRSSEQANTARLNVMAHGYRAVLKQSS